MERDRRSYLGDEGGIKVVLWHRKNRQCDALPVLKFHYLFPILPDIRLVANRSLLPVSYNRDFDHFLVFQNLFCLIFYRNVFDKRQQIGGLANSINLTFLLLIQNFFSLLFLTYNFQ